MAGGQLPEIDNSSMLILGRIVAGTVAVVGFPLHLLLCLCIRLADGGPALYRSQRLGLGGAPFEMLKYRTMKVGCDRTVGPDFKVVARKGDPRVTALGRVLRCGLDECAQIANIVRGEMSWIGPRPDEAWVLSKYGPTSRDRLSRRPGITGLAQVLNSRDWPTARGYAVDVWYCRHRSFSLDTWIAFVTPFFVAGCRSMGRRRLAGLLQSGEFVEIERACAAELQAASGRSAQEAQLGLEV